MNGADWGELIGIVILVLVVFVMAASETAIVRVGRARAYRLAEEDRRGSQSLLKIVENIAPYLNVVLLVTLVATVGGTTLATILTTRHLHHWGEWVATVGMTVLLFVFAEVTPKTFAVRQTDRAALRVAPLIVALTRAVGPLARVLISVANVVMPGKGLPQGPFVTEEEIKAMAEVASEEEAIEEEEKDLIHSIFEFGDTLVREVMVPRPDMVAAPIQSGLRAVLDLMLRHGYSRIPVYRENIDDIIGVVYAKDVLRQKVAELLREMQQRRVHIAIVLDEYGSVAGLVTIEDLLEELVGEIADEYDREEPQIEPVGHDSYRVNGRLTIDELNELLDADLPHDEWDTVAGLMYGLLGSVPTQGETVAFDNLTFTAEKVQGRRIAKVLVARRASDAAEGPVGQLGGAR